MSRFSCGILLLLIPAANGFEQKPARTDALGDPLPAGARIRLGTTRLRSIDWIVDLVFAPDGQSLASVSYRGDVCLWDAKTGRLLRQFIREGGYGLEQSLAFSPEGTIVAAAQGGNVRLWDTTTGRVLRTVEPEDRFGKFYSVAFTPDGQHFLTAGEKEAAHLRDVASGRSIRTFGDASFAISSVTVSPEGRQLVVGFGGGDRRQGDFAPRLYDLATGRLLRRFDGVESPASRISFSPDGRLLASSGEGVRIWEAASGQEVLRIREGHPDFIAFSPDGRSVAIVRSHPGIVDIWDLPTGRRLRSFPTPGDRYGRVAFSPDGKTLATAESIIHRFSEGSLIRLWNVADGTARLTLPGHEAPIESFALSADGKALASGDASGRLLLWDLSTGRPLGRLNLPTQRPWPPSYCPESFSPDGQTLRVRTQDGHFTWDLAAGKKLRETVYAEDARGIPSPDGSWIAVASRDEVVEIWGATGDKPVHQLRPYPVEKGTLASIRVRVFSADSAILATGGHVDRYRSGADTVPPAETIHLWDVKTGRLLHKFRPARNAPTALAFSADRSMLAVLNWREPPSLWDVKTGKLLRDLELPDEGGHDGYRPHRLTFNPDGKLLLVADDMGHLLLYSTATGKKMHRWRAHDGAVTTYQFTPDGRSLFTGSTDKTILVWDLAELLPRDAQALLPPAVAEKPGRGAIPRKLGGLEPEKAQGSGIEENREMFSLHGHTSSVTAISFAPDGKAVLTASNDGLLLLSEASTGRLLQRMDAGQHFDDRRGPSGVLAAAFAPNGSLIVSSSADGLVRFWNPATGKVLRMLDTELKLKVLGVAFAPDSNVLATAGDDNNVRLWNVDTGRLLRTIRLPSRKATAVVFSRDGKVLFTGGFTESQTVPNWPITEADVVRAWDPATGKELPVPGGKANRLTLSPDGRTLALSAVLATYTTDSKSPGLIRSGNVTIDSETVVTLHDLKTGKPRAVLREQGEVIALSPDGLRAATGPASNALQAGSNYVGRATEEPRTRIVDARTGQLLLRLPQEYASALAFTPDGNSLVTGGSEGAVRLWDVTPDRSEVKAHDRRRQSPSAQELGRLWDALKGADSFLAYRAGWDLVSAGDNAVSFLSERLTPRRPIPPERLAALIADLDAKAFAVRTKAAHDLASLGRLAEPALRTALQSQPSAELRRRVEDVLAKLDHSPDADTLRGLRAIAALERANSTAARRLLESMAGGTPQARETVAARDALARLKSIHP